MEDERTMIEEQFEDENKPKTNRKKFVFNEKNYFNDKLQYYGYVLLSLWFFVR